MSKDPLKSWLSLDWSRPERSYNPDAKALFVDVFGYPKDRVVVEDRGGGGFPDVKLLSPERVEWIVGDLKKDDEQVLNLRKRSALWDDKRKYIQGSTRYIIFLTANFILVARPDGVPVADPVDFRLETLDSLRQKLAAISYERSGHEHQWGELTEGNLEFCYLDLDEPQNVRNLQSDLTASFEELTSCAASAFQIHDRLYQRYKELLSEVTGSVVGQAETIDRARLQLELQYEFPRRLVDENLRQFDEHFGRTIDKSHSEKVREAFVSDSAAALIARVLFLRLVEDLGLTSKRRLTNGGPSRWRDFVEELLGDARSLIRVAGEDIARLYNEPFESTVFDWLLKTNGSLDQTLQRLILRLNAYDFSELSEELLGSIYQQFLPKAKRKRLGEFYTPPSVVDWLLDRVDSHGATSLLDPSCGSGSFIVRHAHRRVADARRRNLSPDLAGEELSREVWGFDINPFASFISHFQVTWALIRYLPPGSVPDVHVYNLNSLLKDDDIRELLGEECLPPGSVARDRRQWSAVVGNPPYVRAERGKYADEVKRIWEEVWGPNIDAGVVVLYRAIRQWLEAGGILAMVVSGGFANSEAAVKLWRLLNPSTGVATLRSLVWLEFSPSLWDASVIPMMLVIEKVPPAQGDVVQIATPSDWSPAKAGACDFVDVPYKDFFDPLINPRIVAASGSGEYLLPLLQPKDVTVLRKVQADEKPQRSLGSVIKWTYGIQKGSGATITEDEGGKLPVRVLAGMNLSIARAGAASGWVDVAVVQKKSLWGTGGGPVEYVALPTITRAPTACVVTDPTGKLAVLNSVLVGREPKVEVKLIAAYLNSGLARFVYLIRERTAVLSGSSRATLYPRSLDRLPWPLGGFKQQKSQIIDLFDQLAERAESAQHSPEAWLLENSERALALGATPITSPKFGLVLATDITEGDVEELKVSGKDILLNDVPVVSLNSEDVCLYVASILKATSNDEAQFDVRVVQKLAIPDDLRSLMEQYRARIVEFGSVETEIMDTLARIDDLVYAAFELTDAERKHVEQRIRSYPLAALQPRYPWQTVKPRSISAYIVDRFV